MSGDWDRYKDWVPGDPPPSTIPAPPKAPPPGASHVPSHVRAPRGSQSPQGVTPPSHGPGAFLVVLALVALLGVGGAVAMVAVGRSTNSTTEVVVTEASVAGPTVVDDDLDATADPAPLDLVNNSLEPALAALRGEFGAEFGVQMMVIYPEYVSLRVEPPDLPGELDQVVVYPGRPSLTRSPERNPDPDLASTLFLVAELDVGVLAGLADRARAELGIEGDVDSYLIVDRSRSDDNQVVVSAYISTERRSGYVRFSLAGEIISVHRG